ncbi:NUDIX hydrolase [Streptomyces sp. DSM 41982]|uniref:NUDIX hydrolase n=1 Tax=Streptomyces evansiae TaxID=3075535 RepID=A0ABD5E913_9ACTN|nr:MULTISPECIES: NUDIX hydrolase [unclassified Streptomyces]MDT0417148.1 NUDIX hydrolase [Streptomyces sp. DSM 41982]SCD51227.1 NUDIX domain-containing protein [Streptomyces sp. SolWspMP-sol7th]
MARWPVSVKAVTLDARDRVLLLRNERDEWELPGGHLDPADAGPEAAVVRELGEEAGWGVRPVALLDSWLYEPLPGQRVLILTYGCHLLTPDQAPVLSIEHRELGLFAEGEVVGLRMPEGYKRSVARWYGTLRAREAQGPGSAA